MIKTIRKLFGGIDLTWPKLIIAAVAAGIITGVIALIPALHYTSLHAVTVTFEVWILFGLQIIMNSKSNLDSALKCFVFFLISQPIVYLTQVPFSELGWALFGYYKTWFIWTLLCFPMGFVGYWMKKDKWWGYLILLPMIVLTGYSYYGYFSDFQFSMPRYIFIVLFCAGAMVLYPVMIFDKKGTKAAGAALGGAAVVALTVICLLNPPVYSTEIMASGDACEFDDTWSVSMMRRKTLLGPMRCVWPANSSSVRGRSRDASGWETSVSNKDICSIIIFYYPYILTSNLTNLFRQCYFTTRAVFATADDQRAAQTPETAGTVKACPQGGEC